MKHFSCDACGKDLQAVGELRYVVQVQIKAIGPTECLKMPDLDQNQLDAMAEYLEELERSGDDGSLAAASTAIPAPFEFDLCPNCYRRWLQDPLGRDPVRKWQFSAN